MKIGLGRTVSIEYTMSFENGEIINTNAGGSPLSFVQGQHDIFQEIEQSVEGLEKGASKMVVLPPDKAYGSIDPDAVVTISSEQLPDDAREKGAVVETKDPQGQTMIGEVLELSDGNAVIDFNHPLAGQVIQFDIKILSVT